MAMMFKYTSELRNFFENLPENADSTLPHSTVIENGRKKLFDFDYPIFDESYRKVFETDFIRKFYIRQIGFETFGLFKFQLETWLIINMPYFNKLFESELLQYDPLTNSKMEVTHTKRNDKTQNDTKHGSGTITGKDTSNISGTATGTNSQHDIGTVSDDEFQRHVESNTPDTRLNLTANKGVGVIEYASKITEDSDTNTKTVDTTKSNISTDSTTVDSELNRSATTNTNDTLTSNVNDIEEFIQSRTGKIGVQSYADMVVKYRASLLRIENTIFNEMNELFMLLY